MQNIVMLRGDGEVCEDLKREWQMCFVCVKLVGTEMVLVCYGGRGVVVTQKWRWSQWYQCFDECVAGCLKRLWKSGRQWLQINVAVLVFMEGMY